MSTEIPDALVGYGPHKLASDEGGVDFTARRGGSSTFATMRRADFIAAVEAELGVIVIDKAELPEVAVAVDDERFVEVNGEAYGVKGLREGRSFHERRAREHLALLCWLDENPDPPVDRAAVARLVQAFVDCGASIEGATFEDLVRHGVETKDVTS